MRSRIYQRTSPGFGARPNIFKIEIKNETDNDNENDVIIDDVSDTKYDYLNKYIDISEDQVNYYNNIQLYDIYIISSNLLINNNYLSYLNITNENHLSPLYNKDEKYSKITEHIKNKKQISKFFLHRLDFSQGGFPWVISVLRWCCVVLGGL